MFWTSERNGHHTMIKEVGVDTLFVTCSTCDVVLGRFTQEEFPKYRLAMAAARNVVREHSC